MASIDLRKMALRLKVIEMLKELSSRQYQRQQTLEHWRRLISLN